MPDSLPPLHKRLLRSWRILLSPAAALWLAFGEGPELIDRIIVILLWSICVLSLLAAFTALVFLPCDEAADSTTKGREGPRVDPVVRWAHRLIFAVLLFALIEADRPILAGFWLAALLSMFAARRQYRLEMGRRLLNFRICRNLRKVFGMPEGLVYFAYAEPHQHRYFLGAEGVLAPHEKWVVARDWRDEVKRVLGEPSAQREPEYRLLQRFGVSNLRQHLPFIAIVGKRSELKAFLCNDAYRTRHRDDGKALRALDTQIEEELSQAFAGE